MASTNTHTKTITYPRITAIRNQFRTAFVRIMDYTNGAAEPYLDWISKKKIVAISFWGYKYNNITEKEKWCELTLHVDWEKHNEFVLKGSDHIQLKKNYEDMIPEINAAICWMQEMVEENNLYTSFTISFGKVAQDEYDAFSRAQNLVPAKDYKWHSTPMSEGTVYGQELSELTAEARFCE